MTSRLRTQTERESIDLRSSAVVLGDGFDWSHVPSLPGHRTTRIWKIEPISLPAPSQLPALVRQEARLPAPPPPATAKESSAAKSSARPMPGIGRLRPVKPSAAGRASLDKALPPKPSLLPPRKRMAIPAKLLVSAEPSVEPAEAKSTSPTARSDVEDLTTDRASGGNLGWHPTSGENRAGGGAGAPRLIYNPPPEYPPAALAAGFTGRVLLRVSVRADGTVQSATLFRSSGVDMLDEAALKVIDSWRFAPLDLPSEVWEVVVPIKFALEEP
jgi:protein TonB